MPNLNLADYRDRVLACWMGKNIGGTLGAPFEWRRQVNDVSFYTQDHSGRSLPNDDLDIQLLWLVALEECGLDLDAHKLSEYWMTFVTPHWAEYGNAKVNMRLGLPPPLCGTFQNPYRHSCGAFIRSEIWACVAPAMPDVAARLALQDGMIDHGDGEGTFAEVFFSAAESAAFAVRDLREVIEIGLSHIDPKRATAQAIRLAIALHDEGLPWLECRNRILSEFRGRLMPGWVVSPDDVARGFDTGELGFDVPSNAALTVLALLEGGDDFSKVVCTAVNCGEDTDCTAATAGALFGILHGSAAIPERWLEPIGRGIEVGCLNLGELGSYGDQLPRNLDDLTVRTERIAQRAVDRFGRLALGEGPTDLAGLGDMRSRDGGAGLARDTAGPTFRGDHHHVRVEYAGGPAVASGATKDICLVVRNVFKAQTHVHVRWMLPEGWRAEPSQGTAFVWNDPVALDFRVSAPESVPPMVRGVVEITVPGRATALLVPITLVGSLT